PLAIVVDGVLGDRSPPSWLMGWGKPEQLAALAALTFLLHTLQGSLAAVHNFLAIKIGLRGLMRVRNEVFACLQRLSLRFHHGANSGDLIYRASWDTYAFQTLFQQGLVNLTAAALALL